MSSIFGRGSVVPRRGVLAQLVATEPLTAVQMTSRGAFRVDPPLLCLESEELRRSNRQHDWDGAGE
jgi:hypothetical protein